MEDLLCQFGRHAALLLEHHDELQSGQLAVACSGVIRQDHMARLLAADVPAAAAHFLQNQTVADTGALDLDAVGTQVSCQTHIGHDGGNNAALELALLLEIDRKEGQDIVAVDQIAVLVAHQAAVGITVKGNTQHIIAVLDHFTQLAHVGRAAAVVDIDAVGLAGHKLALCAQLGEDQLGCMGRSTVGAVEEDLHALSLLALGRSQQETAVALVAFGLAIVDAAQLSTVLEGFCRQQIHQFLDLGFLCIVQLVAAAGKDLDAVVLEGVVGSRNDNTGIHLLFAAQPCNGRCGHNAQQINITAAGCNTRSQCALQHIAGNSCILTDADLGGSAQALGHAVGQRCTDVIGHHRGQLGVGNTSDAVCSKIFTHNLLSPMLKVPAGLQRECSDACRPSGWHNGHGGYG